MNTTMPIAIDEMLTMFLDAWKDASKPFGAGGNTMVDVRWPNDGAEAEPDQKLPWARVVVQHVNGDQYSLGVPGNRLWEHEGLFVVQIYVPVGHGLAPARALAMVAKNAFEGRASPSGVWFRHCHFQEVGRDAENREMRAWDQTNFIAQFVYDEQR